MYACSENTLDVVNYLIECGADIQHRTAMKSGVLHFAALNDNDIRVLPFLMGKKINKTMRNIDHADFVDVVFGRNNSLDLIKIVINECSFVNKRIKNGQLLLESATNSNIEVMKLLIAMGANVNYRTPCDINKLADIDKKDFSPILSAIHMSDAYDRCKLLLENGANVDDHLGFRDKRMFRLIHSAAQNGNVKLAELLIDYGADVNAADMWLRTPLMLAAKYSKEQEIIQYLLNSGADLHLKNNEGMTAYNCILENKYLRKLAIVNLLK